MKQFRTVHYASGGNGTIPMIRLQGNWLRDAGFRVSAKYRVEMLNIGALLIKRIFDGETNNESSNKQNDENKKVEERMGHSENSGGDCGHTGAVLSPPETMIEVESESRTERTNKDGT